MCFYSVFYPLSKGRNFELGSTPSNYSRVFTVSYTAGRSGRHHQAFGVTGSHNFAQPVLASVCRSSQVRRQRCLLSYKDVSCPGYAVFLLIANFLPPVSPRCFWLEKKSYKTITLLGPHQSLELSYVRAMGYIVYIIW